MTQVLERTIDNTSNPPLNLSSAYETSCLKPDRAGVERIIMQGTNKQILEYYGLPDKFSSAVDELRTGRVVGPEAGGWLNIGHHNMVSGSVFLALCYATGQDLNTTHWAGMQAATHDKNKRKEVEIGATSQVMLDGIERVRYNLQIQLAIERAKKGLAKGTGIDFTGYKKWGLLTLAMRWTDSHVGPTIEGFSQNGQAILSFDHLIPWELRRRYLEQMKPDLNKVAGDELYGGVPAFTVCDQATQWADQQLLARMKKVHPELFYQYSPNDNPQLYDLVEGILQGRIWTPSVPQYLH